MVCAPFYHAYNRQVHNAWQNTTFELISTYDDRASTSSLDNKKSELEKVFKALEETVASFGALRIRVLRRKYQTSNQSLGSFAE